MLSDFLVGQAAEEDQCDQLARHGIKGRQRRVHAGAVLAGRQEVGRVAAILGFDLQQGMRFGVAQGGIGPAQMVEGTAAGNGQDPRQRPAAGRIVAQRLAPYLKEDVLHHLLGGHRIPDDTQDDAMHPATGGVIELGQGILVATSDALKASGQFEVFGRSPSSARARVRIATVQGACKAGGRRGARQDHRLQVLGHGHRSLL